MCDVKKRCIRVERCQNPFSETFRTNCKRNATGSSARQAAVTHFVSAAAQGADPEEYRGAGSTALEALENKRGAERQTLILVCILRATASLELPQDCCLEH